MNNKFLFLFWLLFIVTHIINVANMPIFEDEGEYLLLAEAIKQNIFANLFIYLQNGLLPMFGWLVALISFIFSDTLIAGRVLNVLLASTLIFWIPKIARIFNMSKFFVFASELLLIVSPIILLNSRVALLDTSVLVFIAWYIYFTAKVIKEKKWIDSVWLFFSLVGALLTKATALFGLLPVIYLCIDGLLGKKYLKEKFVKIAVPYFLAFAIFLGFFLVFSNEIENDSGSSLITHLAVSKIFAQIKNNAWLTVHWFGVYYQPLLLGFLAPLLFYRHIKQRKLYLLMGMWIFSSLLFMVFFNRFYYPRHLLLISLPLITIIAGIISEIPRKYGLLLFLIILSIRLSLSYDIVTNPFYADIALEDRFSYFEDYSSGVNIPKVTQRLQELSSNGSIVVWLDGSYVFEYGLRREFEKNANISFKSFSLGDRYIRHEPGFISKDSKLPTYVVINRWNPKNKNELKLVESYKVSFRHTQYLYLIL